MRLAKTTCLPLDTTQMNQRAQEAGGYNFALLRPLPLDSACSIGIHPPGPRMCPTAGASCRLPRSGCLNQILQSVAPWRDRARSASHPGRPCNPCLTDNNRACSRRNRTAVLGSVPRLIAHICAHAGQYALVIVVHIFRCAYTCMHTRRHAHTHALTKK